MEEPRSTGPEPFPDSPSDLRRASEGIGRLTAGLMVVWLGVVLVLRGTLDPWWGYMLSGFGVILLVEAMLRMSRPDPRRPAGSRIVGGIVLLLVGSVFISGIADWWALALVVVGLVFVVQGVRQLRTKSGD